MRFISICAPSYAYIQREPSEAIGRYWRVLGLVLAAHCLAIFLFEIEPIFNKPAIEDEIIINLSPPIVIPETIPERVKVDRREKKQPAKASINPIAKSVPVQPVPVEPAPIQPIPIQPTPVQPKPFQATPLPVPQIQVPQAVDNTPVMKVNEVAVKPIKVEPVQEKPVEAASLEKVEEKKIPEQVSPKVQAQSQTPAPPAPPVQEEVVSKFLPALVDRKNKDKDAPQVAPPADSGKGGAVAASSSSSSSSSSSFSVASTPQASGSSASASASSASAEMQAQIAPSKSVALSVPVGNVANAGNMANAGNTSSADADYKSESLRNAPPRYPMYARKMRQEGVVIVSAEVLTDGSANEVRVAASSGIKLLDEAALEAVKQWKFTPAKRDGVAYAQRLRIPVTFSLNSR